MIPAQGLRRSTRLSHQPSGVALPSTRQRGAAAQPIEAAQPSEAESGETAAPSQPGRGPGRGLEEALWAQGYARVAGVDEAGRGPLSGPVVAGACILPASLEGIDGIDDSKKLSEAQRERIYEALMSHPNVVCATAVVDASMVDSINILQATLLAMERAVAALPGSPPDYLLVDGNQLPRGFAARPAETVIKGDSKSAAIAAASILAKVTRDRLMQEYDKQWPVYGFARHKGYGTVAHLAAIREHGPCPIHRRSFAPLKSK
ncbi:hypothetical protein WJX72_001255 [[Myrmecia] bisecta]|uniref:Ribonuclease n=1 Tax=[Myrmecia] bisecta TaxID=41462 RepID=A0AAW1Q6H3_9CHLO